MDLSDSRVREYMASRIIDALADAGVVGDEVALDQTRFQHAVEVAAEAMHAHIRAIALDTPS